MIVYNIVFVAYFLQYRFLDKIPALFCGFDLIKLQSNLIRLKCGAKSIDLVQIKFIFGRYFLRGVIFRFRLLSFDLILL